MAGDKEKEITRQQIDQVGKSLGKAPVEFMIKTFASRGYSNEFVPTVLRQIQSADIVNNTIVATLLTQLY